MNSPAPSTETDQKKDRKLSDERRQLILDQVENEGRVLVSDLAQTLSVSEVTIRNDLNMLAEEGMVQRTHGGAFKPGQTVLDRSISEKQRLHAQEKRAIAERAAKLVQDGMCVLLDSGSTTTELARVLRNMNQLTVITNALNIAMGLKDSPGLQVILPGGIIRAESISTVGDIAHSVLSQLTADVVFLGVDGADPEVGFTTPNLAEAALNRKMIEIARQVVVVTDSSKFGRRSLAVICGPDKVDLIITDSAIPQVHLKAFTQLGVEIQLVDVR